MLPKVLNLVHWLPKLDKFVRCEPAARWRVTPKIEILLVVISFDLRILVRQFGKRRS